MSMWLLHSTAPSRPVQGRGSKLNSGLYYAGIGSRQTPDKVLERMEKLAARLAELGFVLRSGAAGGADQAFERGCDKAAGVKEIYLPWKDFSDSQSPLFTVDKQAIEMASQFHPGWHHCTPAAQKLHGRNCYQILGADLKTPAKFVICWTPDGCEGHETRTSKSGGTGQAISVATANGIQVFNLFNADVMDRIANAVKASQQEMATI